MSIRMQGWAKRDLAAVMRNTERMTDQLICDFGHSVKLILKRQTLR